jgi:hypothetical protein
MTLTPSATATAAPAAAPYGGGERILWSLYALQLAGGAQGGSLLGPDDSTAQRSQALAVALGQVLPSLGQSGAASLGVLSSLAADTPCVPLSLLPALGDTWPLTPADLTGAGDPWSSPLPSGLLPSRAPFVANTRARLLSVLGAIIGILALAGLLLSLRFLWRAIQRARDSSLQRKESRAKASAMRAAINRSVQGGKDRGGTMASVVAAAVAAAKNVDRISRMPDAKNAAALSAMFMGGLGATRGHSDGNDAVDSNSGTNAPAPYDHWGQPQQKRRSNAAAAGGPGPGVASVRFASSPIALPSAALPRGAPSMRMPQGGRANSMRSSPALMSVVTDDPAADGQDLYEVSSNPLFGVNPGGGTAS